MAVKRIPIISKNNEYSVEANPDGSGIRFMQKFPNGYTRWAATIIDNGDEFVFAKLLMTGVEIQSFSPTMEMQLKNGKMPPVEVDNQVETNTPYAKKMFARYLFADEKPSGGNYRLFRRFKAVVSSVMHRKGQFAPVQLFTVKICVLSFPSFS